MALSTTDLDYINQRMDTYDIKYQEIYDEIKDHVLSAIETARANGDERNIADLLEDVVEAQFPGYWAFEDISKSYEKAYRTKIQKLLWDNMKRYLNLKTIPLILLALIFGFYIPQNRVVSLFFMIALMPAAIIPYAYVLRKSRLITLKAGKKSLIKNQIITRAYILILFLNLMLNLVGMIGRDYHINFLNPRYFYPDVYILLITLFVIYGLSCIRLCRQELRLGNV